MSSPRSHSPPPPMPSPQLVPTPLPSPPLFSRRRTLTTSSTHSVHHHLLSPPPLVVEKRIHSSRSFDAFSHTVRRRDPTVDCDEFGTSSIRRKYPRPSHTNNTNNNNGIPSPPTTPRSLPIPIPTASPRRRSHCTSLSFAIPYRSPPPSPTIASPPPPVPPIPAFALAPTDKKPVLHAQQQHHQARRSSPAPVYLPSLSISPSSDPVSMPSRKHTRSVVVPRGETGMTCQQFFAMRSSTPRDVGRTTAV